MIETGLPRRPRFPTSVRAAAAGLAALCVVALAPAKPSAAETIRAGTFDLVPWGHLDERGQRTGILYQLTNRVIREAGYAPKNGLYPVRRALEFIRTGEIDVMAFLLIPDFSGKHAIGVGRVATVQNVVLGLRGRTFRSAADLAGVTVAEPIGFMNDKVPAAYRRMKRIGVRNYTNAIRMLKLGRTQTVVGPLPALRYVAAREGLKPEALGEPFVLFTAEIWLQMSKKSKRRDALPKLREALKRLHQRGEVERLMGARALGSG